MFDFGWTHILILLVVALVVVGPKDLPKVMRTLGQWAGRARAMADQFRRSFDDMARQSELDELRTEVNRLKHEATRPMTEADYQSYGIDPGELPKLDEVGAAPPAAFNAPAAETPGAAPEPATESPPPHSSPSEPVTPG